MLMVVIEVADLIISTAMNDPEEKLIVYAEMWPLQYNYDSRSLSPAFNKLVFFSLSETELMTHFTLTNS